jgi:hypothetical protein
MHYGNDYVNAHIIWKHFHICAFMEVILLHILHGSAFINAHITWKCFHIICAFTKVSFRKCAYYMEAFP